MPGVCMETQSFNIMCAESKIHDLEEKQQYAIQAKNANREFPKQLNNEVASPGNMQRLTESSVFDLNTPPSQGSTIPLKHTALRTNSTGIYYSTFSQLLPHGYTARSLQVWPTVLSCSAL